MSRISDAFPSFFSALRRLWRSRAFRILVRLAFWFLVLVFAAHTITTVVLERRLTAGVDAIEKKYGSLHPASLAPPKVSAADNQAPLFRAAGDALTLSDKEYERIGEIGSKPATFAGDVDDIRRILDANRLTFEIADAAARRTGSNWDIRYKDGEAARIPDLLKLIHLEKTIAARALLDLHEGRHKDAIADLEPAAALAFSLEKEPVLIVQLIRIAVERTNRIVIREIVTRSSDLDVADLSRLERMLPAPSDAISLRAAFVGEMKMGYKLFQDLLEGKMPTARPGISGDTEFAPNEGRTGFFELWATRPWILWEGLAHLELYDSLAADLERPRYARTTFFVNGKDHAPKVKGLFNGIVIPNLLNAVLRADLNTAGADLTRTALALESYRIAHHAYPDALDALVPQWLSRVPVDPFSGHALEYRREGAGYVLRSAGDDAAFDVGMPDYDKALVYRIAR